MFSNSLANEDTTETMASRCFFEGWRLKLAKYSSPNSLLILLEETGFLKLSIFSAAKREILGKIAVE